MVLSYPPYFVQKIYSSLIWKVDTKKREIYLTFDDGPTVGVTDKVLDLLNDFSAKATFFCVGKNIQNHPELFRRILNEGHTVGNHTSNHTNGWKNTTQDFLHDVRSFEELYSTKLFRPPYGRLKNSQIKLLKKQFKIIMWTILTMDYDPMVSIEKCEEIAVNNWKPGSILVFHDSVKAEEKMLVVLKKVLEKAKQDNWECKAIC